tara:strand:+ start:3829 stop:4359 length:531 start_codon:yes stop_codon:yes gene_type:complete
MNLALNITPEAHKKDITINARRALNGDIMIYDHPEVDIVIRPAARKVVIFAKDKMSDDVYDVQDRIFEYLGKKGVVDVETIQGGNMYGVLEATYPKSEEVNSLNMVLLALDAYIQEDKSYYIYNDVFEKMEQEMLDPDEEASTELGEVPHEETQGAIRPGYIYPYGSFGSVSLYRM